MSDPSRELVDFLARICAAKSEAARRYEACSRLAPSDGARTSLSTIVAEERRHATKLGTLMEATVRCGALGDSRPPAADGFGSSLMLAFALDQAASAALVGLGSTSYLDLASLAAHILEAEATHQESVLRELSSLAREQSETGRRLAREMIDARDWIKVVFPRHEPLERLIRARQLEVASAQTHDRFLASLGDRIQAALGVLGE